MFTQGHKHTEFLSSALTNMDWMRQERTAAFTGPRRIIKVIT